MIHEKLRKLESDLHYAFYSDEIKNLMQKVWTSFYELKKSIEKNEDMIQIDAIEKTIDKSHIQCNMYTRKNCVKVFISIEEYNELVEQNFFIRDGKKKDNAGVLNTTNVFIQK